MSSAFDSEVYAERQRLPGAAVNLPRLMHHLLWEIPGDNVTLTLERRPDVETSQWWTVRWGKDQFAAATTLELALFRAAVLARRDDERAKKYAGMIEEKT